MSDYAPRCPFCANVLKLQPSFWERIGLKSTKTLCPTCHRSCDARDAHTMGAAYWHWAEVFRKEFVEALEELPILSEAAMERALGRPHKDDTRLIPSVEELVRTCLRHQRAVLIEMARGREATLEIVHLVDEKTTRPETIAVLGTSSTESGAKECEQLVARFAVTHFVLYNYPTKLGGAESRVKRAIHEKVKKPRVLTDAHAIGTTVAAANGAKHAHHA